MKLDGHILVLQLLTCCSIRHCDYPTSAILSSILWHCTHLVFLLPCFFSIPFLGSSFSIYVFKWGFPGNTWHSSQDGNPPWMISFILMASVIIYMLMFPNLYLYAELPLFLSIHLNIVRLEASPAPLMQLLKLQHHSVTLALSSMCFTSVKVLLSPGCLSQKTEHHPWLFYPKHLLP